MNIFLVPYTWVRHIVVALVVGGAALTAWWFTVFYLIILGPLFHRIGMYWWASVDGLMYFCFVSSAIAFASVLAEGSLRRRPVIWRILYSIVSWGVTIFLSLLGYSAWMGITPYLGSQMFRPVLEDTSLVTLRYRLPIWIMCGLAAGIGPFVVRRGLSLASRFGYGVDSDNPGVPLSWLDTIADLVLHWMGSLIAVLAAVSIWHILGFYEWAQGDLYLASAVAAFVWGFTHGLLVWGVPDDLYTGWVRVLSAERFGTRIPIERADGQPAERFVGHFPRGLDLYLPADKGVLELHTSFVKTADGTYTVRGLSIAPTIVKRFLERLDLRYDPRKPSPLETELQSEDRIILTNGAQESVLEFLMLPREEK